MAVIMSLAQLISLATGCLVAYSIVKGGNSVLRVVLGVSLGFILGWSSLFAVGWVFGSVKSVSPETVMRLLGTTFWMSVIGSVGGAYYGRKKQNTRDNNRGAVKKSTSHSLNDDDIYGIIANEIESGKTDKGLWTRLYADNDGDEVKTKVAYIKCRVECLSNPGVDTAKTLPVADNSQPLLVSGIRFVIVGAIAIGVIVAIFQAGKTTRLEETTELSPAKYAACKQHSDCPPGPPAQTCNLKTNRCFERFIPFPE